MSQIREIKISKKLTFLAVAAWLLIISASATWNVWDDKREIEHISLESARALFQQIVLDRSWNARHGGVYVPITKTTVPNPYLEEPLRDLETLEGISLTKINPAFMTRQISKIAQENTGVQFHITSLHPIRPANKATDWELEWLKEFEKGEKERSELISDSSGTIYRYMAPLFVTDGCMKCHAKQGYEVGDIRGGISVTLPFISFSSAKTSILVHGLIFFVGLAGIILAHNLLGRSNQSLISETAFILRRLRGNQNVVF